ncbi:single-stranded-DNA-specific exonuclease RecJ [Hydrogenimonas cancrithermarum]|uniref:Single-stranded-DNA-specific exonuclease RecJ n=1 Tax=Hydrogenimonas cancrithermarum TaxID=2993563 RepID=A0ABN6WVQ3_9BACT|nr:single-stranded-DNA-specific exonuclease RecJ [Hydrogenimonas cancrithermarum]BDY12913.1 single-stranded-DNA-specific exonuclease [Hydrogenimonas cancrithermarum]BDY13030.1 single-stranded-DNA-specific exonuclease [Hydrogenimonas cancrithermarum]
MSNLPRLTKAKIAALLAARFDDGFKTLKELPSPFELHDMERAAERIVKAIERKERIVVIGDYDVDGVVSSALMEEFFEIIGYPVEVIIPNRFRDGYGISPKILERVDADVVMTVDNGITAIDAAEVCRRRGIDLIITDHHTPSETLPDAYAIVNPKKEECSFAYPEICGAQVAWFLIGALKQRLGLDLRMGRFLDLLALAIVADVMPLTSINRPLVKKGIEMLSISQRPAFEAVRAYLGKSRFGAEDIGYGIAPRINSAGRMEDASIALRFLRAKTLSDASREWMELDNLNQMRRRIETETTEAAFAMANPSDSVIVVAGEGWHDGVVGIVASRLVDRFKKPAIVLSIENGVAKGSGRSIGEVDLFSLLDDCSGYLDGFGGHKMAAGLRLDAERVDAFRAALCKTASALDPELFFPKEHLMGELPITEVDWELMEILSRFEPYGEANIKPRFLIKDISIIDARVIGAEKNHLKLILGSSDRKLQAIQFGYEKMVEIGQKVAVTGSLQINEFNNKRSVQMLIDKIH